MPERKTILQNVEEAIHGFGSGQLRENGIKLLNALGYDSDKTYDLRPNTYEGFFEDFGRHEQKFNEKNALPEEWRSADILFQVADEDLNRGQSGLFEAKDLQKDRFNSLLFMTIALEEESYTRTDLAKITREVNKVLRMPIIILFEHGGTLTLSVIQRRGSKTEDDDVLEKVTLVKDIDIVKPHRAHLEILTDLSLDELAEREKHRISNFETLFRVWQEALDTTELNKRFYKELSNWYFWAKSQAQFPTLPDENRDERVSTAMIRLITRLIFVWFLKEKKLVPEPLFDKVRVNGYLSSEHQVGGKGDSYYKAILQNLFFATLNTEMNRDVADSRGFKQEGKKGQGYNTEYMTHTRYRYRSYFKDPEAALELFQDVPFLNGGLFECLDKAAADSASGKEERIDGFSDKSAKTQASVPDILFFGEDDIDLNEVYGTKNKRLEHVRGILRIFERYKFTIDENTPVEEEVALDPELLGKVFENLLASYNPETQTTARKQTGSFYTPREIVNYMVDESLIAYLTGKLQIPPTPLNKGGSSTSPPLTRGAGGDQDTGPGAAQRLRQLFAYSDAPHEFTEAEVTTLIAAIDDLKILDPACGSGAFPMGALLRLVEILGQLDPDNERWKRQQKERAIQPVLQDKQTAEKISYEQAREKAVQELDERLREIEAAFEENDHNYARKLFLIENCIYGVDIQPIAVQIAKLRFFVSLIVDQRVKEDKPNRGILALPNLETKFVAANTLLSLDTQTGLVPPEVAEKEAALERVRSQHFNARRYAEKKALREKDKKLRGEIEGLLAGSGFGKEVAHQLAGWNPYDQSRAAAFFDARWMFDANEGFDVVIGNPPYVRHEGIKELKPDLKTRYESYTGTADLYVYFFERGVKLLREGGVLTYICSNKYFRSAYGQNLRHFLGTKTSIKLLIDFGDAPVFTAIAYPSILTTVREKPKDNTLRALSWDEGQPLENFTDIWETQNFKMPQSALTADGWRLERKKVLELLSKIRNAGTPLGEYVNGRFYYGIKTGFNEAFVVDRQTRDRLIAEHPSSADVLKPFLRGRDVKRWKVEYQDLWLLFIPWHFPLHDDASISGVSVEAEKAFQKRYPAVYKHLLKFKPQLESRNKAETGIRYEWYALQRCAATYWREFEEPKILYQEIATYQAFAWSDKGEFTNNKTFLIPGAGLYLLAVLNSKAVWFFLDHVASKLQGGAFAMQSPYVSQIPIPQPKSEHIFELLVTYILHLSKCGEASKTKVLISYLERILDGMVYELYLPDELHSAGRHIIKHVEAEGLPRLEDIGGDKLAALQEIFERLYAEDHPVRENLYLEGVEAVRILEGGA